MFNMAGSIFKFFGGLVVFKFLFLLWIMLTLFMFSFTSRPNPSLFDKMPIHKQMSYNFVDNIRHNIRIAFGVIVPMRPHYFKNLTEQQKKSLPDPKFALYKWSKNQEASAIRMGEGMRGAEATGAVILDQVFKRVDYAKEKMKESKIKREPGAN